MNTTTYQFDIDRADAANTLHAIGADIKADDMLTLDEKDALLQSVRERFSALNAAANRSTKPRW